MIGYLQSLSGNNRAFELSYVEVPQEPLKECGPSVLYLSPRQRLLESVQDF